jgi:hypothetical protein
VIAVGVRDREYDAATLEWARYEAAPEVDVLHVVHAYIPLHLDGRVWEPTRPERDARALVGRRITEQAVQRVRDVWPELRVAGTAIPGLPKDVLQEFSCVADLLVIGAASRVQCQAHCPVVTVPRGYYCAEQSKPVTVVVSTQAASSQVMRFAADAAQRHGVELCVATNVLDDRDWRNIARTSGLVVTGPESDGALSGMDGAGCPIAVVSCAAPRRR